MGIFEIIQTFYLFEYYEIGKVVDRTDAALVHLDGLNFSRASNLYSIIENLNSTDPQDLKLK